MAVAGHPRGFPKAGPCSAPVLWVALCAQSVTRRAIKCLQVEVDEELLALAAMSDDDAQPADAGGALSSAAGAAGGQPPPAAAAAARAGGGVNAPAPVAPQADTQVRVPRGSAKPATHGRPVCCRSDSCG